jgi:hypothetical protein
MHLIPFRKKQNQASKEIQTEESRDMIKFLYLSLNYGMICSKLTSHSPASSELGKSQYGLHIYEKFAKKAHHFLENYLPTHHRLLGRDTEASFIPDEMEDMIEEIVNEGEHKLQELIKS